MIGQSTPYYLLTLTLLFLFKLFPVSSMWGGWYLEERHRTDVKFISSNMCLKSYQWSLNTCSFRYRKVCIHQITVKIVLTSTWLKMWLIRVQNANYGEKSSSLFCCIPFSVLTSVVCHVFTPSISSLIVCAWLRLCIFNDEVTYNMIMILSITVTDAMPVWWRGLQNKIK